MQTQDVRVDRFLETFRCVYLGLFCVDVLGVEARQMHVSYFLLALLLLCYLLVGLVRFESPL